MTTAKDERNDGGAAFPREGQEDGLSKRDYFAAAALTGMLANIQTHPAMRHAVMVGEDETEALARLAYEAADAMLNHRSK